VDTAIPDGSLADLFMDRSASAYRSSYQRDPVRHFWHGVNLSALAHAATQRGMVTSPGPSAVEYATKLLASLDSVALSERDQWWSATKAEAHVARSEWTDAENALRDYINHRDTTPFSLASTLRQLRDVWTIQTEKVGARLLQMLEATLMSRPDGMLKVEPSHVVTMRSLERDPEKRQVSARPLPLSALFYLGFFEWEFGPNGENAVDPSSDICDERKFVNFFRQLCKILSESYIGSLLSEIVLRSDVLSRGSKNNGETYSALHLGLNASTGAVKVCSKELLLGSDGSMLVTVPATSCWPVTLAPDFCQFCGENTFPLTTASLYALWKAF